MRHQILITGIGGQGVLFLSKLLQTAALIKDVPIFAYEIHGMSQRGGSVYTSLKIGGFESPQVFPGDVDTLLALDRGNIFPYLHFLRPGGTLAVNSAGLSPREREWLEGRPYRCIFRDADSRALELRNPRASNLVLLGSVFGAEGFPFAFPEVAEALRRSVRPELLESNLQALQ